MFRLFFDTVIDDNFGMQDFSEKPMIAVIDGDDNSIAWGDVLAFQNTVDDLWRFGKCCLGEEGVEDFVVSACL